MAVALIIQTLITYISLKIYICSKSFTFKECLLFVLYLLNNVFIFSRFGNIGLVLQILLLFLIAFHIQKDWKLSLSSLSVIMIINILADHLTTAILSAILQTHIIDSNILTHSLVFLLLHSILTLSIVLIARHLFKINQHLLDSQDGKNLFTLGVTLIFVVFELNIAFELNSGNNKNMIKLNLLFFTSLLLIAFISVAFYIQSVRHSYRVKQQKLEFEVMKMYTNNLEQHYSEIRKFRQDYQNILTSLEGYIANKDYVNLENYFYEHIKPTSREIQGSDFILKDLSNLKIESIKSLLASKAALAKEKDINVVIEITEPIREIAIPPISLIRMLGIILDNAIEGVDGLDEKQLWIAFTKDKTAVHIIVENTCSAELPKLHILKKEGFSTKGENRGLGLHNLQELVNSVPNSTLLTKIENNRFNQTITITN